MKWWRLINQETLDVCHEGWKFFEPDHRDKAPSVTTHTLSSSSSFVWSSKFDYKVKLTQNELSCQSACTMLNEGGTRDAGVETSGMLLG